MDDRDGPRAVDRPSLRVALHGPGRARNGTGPFLARWFERAGARIVACAGRDLERTRRAAAAIEDARDNPSGHRIEPYASLSGMLSGTGADVLAIATPADAHREALRAGLGLSMRGVYCEKPLVAPDELGSVGDLLDAYRDAGILLVENCQWPEVLPVFDVLWPGVRQGPIRRIAMGMAPSGTGLDMVLDSLSHLLSVVQDLLPVDRTTDLLTVGAGRETSVHWATRDDAATSQELRFTLAGPFEPVEIRFVLARGEVQPRPAWIAIDGNRIDRRVRVEDYTIGFVAAAGEDRSAGEPVTWTGPADAGEGAHIEVVGDPLGSLVYRFVDSIDRQPRGEIIRDESERIRQRSRLFTRILDTW